MVVPELQMGEQRGRGLSGHPAPGPDLSLTPRGLWKLKAGLSGQRSLVPPFPVEPQNCSLSERWQLACLPPSPEASSLLQPHLQLTSASQKPSAPQGRVLPRGCQGTQLGGTEVASGALVRRGQAFGGSGW